VEETKDNKGKIAVIVFLLVLLLPVSYALYKEYRLKKEKNITTRPATEVPATK